MPEALVTVLDDDSVLGQLLRAWKESQPGTTSAQEEGGFVLRDPDGSLHVERWPTGVQSKILVPPHPGGIRGARPILATFHTHPNPGEDYQQEPSLTDIRAVRDDPELGHADYEGEYVIATDAVYRIRRNGQVEVVGDTRTILKMN